MFIPPPLLLLGAIVVSYLAGKVAPGLQITGTFLPIVGVVLIGAGVTMFVWTIQLFRKQKTTIHPRGKPASLITSGPFRFSRNPIYLGFLLISTGTAVLFANVLSFMGPVIFFFFISTLVIPFEEGMLTNVFGESYGTYSRKIRRWL